MVLRLFTLIVPFALLASGAFSQLPTQGKPDAVTSKTGKPFSTLYFQTNIGSFRLIGSQGFDTAKRSPAEGRVEMVFSGTVLINDLNGKVTTTGNIRKEFDKNGRVAYFGKGRMVIEGQFWAVQFFGTNLDARWTGWGIARLYGEFDDKLNTGFYWFSNVPKKQYWSPYGSQFNVPNTLAEQNSSLPKERKQGGGR